MKKQAFIIFLVAISYFPINLCGQELYRYDSSNSMLPESWIRCVAVDSTNTIWLGAEDAAYSLVNNSWIKIDSAFCSDSVGAANITDIEVSPSGDIWFSTGERSDFGTEKLYLKRNNEWLKFKPDYDIRYPIKIFIENDTTLYLTLYNYWPHQLGDDAVGIMRSEELEVIRPKNVVRISSVIPISKDTLMLSSWEGISFYNGDTNIVNNPEGIDTVQWGLAKVNENIFVYERRLFQYKNASYILFPEIDSVLAIDSSKVTCMSIEGDNILWLGTNDGKLIRYDRVSIEVSNLIVEEIFDLVVDKYGNKWFVTWKNCYVFNESKIVEVEDNIDISHPDKISLSQNYPNPFNPSTIIKYEIPSVRTGHAQSVRLTVYDILGREVATLVNKEQKPGSYEVKFNASNLTSGIYFYSLRSGSYVKSMKMILLK